MINYQQTEKKLWQIFVPTMIAKDDDPTDVKPVRTRYHRVWDEKVRAVCGGLTIYRPVIGQWEDPEDDKRLYKERMIPVQIACSEGEIELIIKMTKTYYKQKKVLCYLVSDRVKLI